MQHGWTLHLHRVTAERARAELSAMGFRGAVLAHDATWCSVGAVVADAEQTSAWPDVAATARALDCDALAVFFDESSLTFTFESPRGLRGDFSVDCFEPLAPSAEDLRFFDALSAAGCAPPSFGADLSRALAARPSKASKWVRAHGIERLLGLPFIETVSVGSTLKDLRDQVPDVLEIVPAEGASRREPPPAQPAQPETPPTRIWTAHQRAVVALHQHYVTRLWEPNDWTLYNLYKRHLPADRRTLVDDAFMGDLMDEESVSQRAAVETILALAWEGTDWVAVLRKPRILDEGLSEEKRADWHQRLAALASV